MNAFTELPQTYLEERAGYAGLTLEQTRLFLLKFQQAKHNRAIASELDITVNACVQCLGEIYRKFGIEGRGRGKEKRLRDVLVQGYESRQSDQPAGGVPDQESVMVALQPMAQTESSAKALTRFAQAAPPAANAQFLRGWVRSLRYSQTNLNHEEGQEMVDDILQSLFKTLPVAVTALAAETPNTKAEIVAKLLDRLDQLVLELQPRVEKDRLPQLRFFLQQNSNPLARSVFAFVLRLRSQLGLTDDDFMPWEVIDEAMENVKHASSGEAKPPWGMKAYSRMIRQQCCLSIIQRSQHRKSAPSVDSIAPEVLPERLQRGLQAIDHALLDLYLATKQRSEANIDFFNILRTRWLEPLEWGRYSTEIQSNRNHWASRNYLATTLEEQWDFEIKALRALRVAFHNYDQDSFEQLYADFGQKVQVRHRTYCEKLFYPLREPPTSGFYKLVAVPRGDQLDQADILLSNQVWRYAILMAKPQLTALDLDEIQKLLDDAATRPGLDFWLREVDHLIAHETEMAPDSLLEVEQIQQAELKKHSIRL